MNFYKSKIPFINYVFEDKSKYPLASSAGYKDDCDDFRIGDSGGFLCNIDFVFKNTHLLREAGISYEKYGYYTDFEVDSIEHINFRKQEEANRRNGITRNCKLYFKDIEEYNKRIKSGDKEGADKLLHPLTITGDHYNYINYGRINKLLKSTVKISIVNGVAKVSGKKAEGIPEFFDSQYWWYKIQQFGFNNSKHLLGAKSRRKGCSYMGAIDTANEVNLNPKMTVIHAAFDFKYLTKGRSITPMTLDQLDFYDTSTPFVRGLISRDLEGLYLGYKHKTKGTDMGYLSRVLSVSSGPNNPDCAIGKDATKIKVEELSNLPNFDSFMAVTEPTIRTGSITTGFISAWGTGGSTEGKVQVFEKNFYNPSKYNFLEFENVWDANSRNKKCGYFLPYVQALQGFNELGESSLDDDGNTIYHIAEEISNNERLAFKNNPENTEKDYLDHIGQYSNSPSEAFSTSSSNLFTTPALIKRVDELKHNPDLKTYTDGNFTFDKGGYKFRSNAYLKANDIKTYEYLDLDTIRNTKTYDGAIRIFRYPYRKGDGTVPDNMFMVTYDPIAKDKQAITSSHSMASITVWMLPNPYITNLKILRCASYVGRKTKMQDIDKIAYNLCLMYNAKLGYESNRGEVKSNFTLFGGRRLLLKEPADIWDNKIASNKINEYGVNLKNDIVKYQGLLLAKSILYEEIGRDNEDNPIYFYQVIDDYDFLKEILSWNITGNFDRISDFIIFAFYYTKFTNDLLKKMNNEKTNDDESYKTHILEREWF